MAQLDSTTELRINTLTILARIIARDILRKSMIDQKSSESAAHQLDSQVSHNTKLDKKGKGHSKSAAY